MMSESGPIPVPPVVSRWSEQDGDSLPAEAGGSGQGMHACMSSYTETI